MFIPILTVKFVLDFHLYAFDRPPRNDEDPLLILRRLFVRVNPRLWREATENETGSFRTISTAEETFERPRIAASHTHCSPDRREMTLCLLKTSKANLQIFTQDGLFGSPIPMTHETPLIGTFGTQTQRRGRLTGTANTPRIQVKLMNFQECSGHWAPNFSA